MEEVKASNLCFVCVCVCVCVFVFFCVCVCERERKAQDAELGRPHGAGKTE